MRSAAASLQHRLVAWRDSLVVRSVSSRDSGGAVPSVPSDQEFLAYNQGVISEFRANHGVVSQPPFPILLLTTTGARTGRSTTVPLGFAVDDNGRVFVMASKAGAPSHPAWFHNLRANPSVTVELGDKSFPAQAVVTEGEERDRLYGFPGHRARRRSYPRLMVESTAPTAVSINRLTSSGWLTMER